MIDNIYPMASVTSTPTPTPTPTPSPTPPVLARQTYMLRAKIDGASAEIDMSSPLTNSSLLKDIDGGIDVFDNMTVLGMTSNTQDSTDTDLFIIDKKPYDTNVSYINGNPNVVLGLFDNTTNPIAVSLFRYPSNIIPLGESEIGSKIPYLDTDPHHKPNICLLNKIHRASCRWISATPAQFSEELCRYVAAARLKTGFSLIDSDIRLGYDLINPTANSPLLTNKVFYSYDNTAMSIVSVAYYAESEIFFIAAIDNDGNGQIIMLDGETAALTELYTIYFPVDSNGLSDVDIVFDLYIKSARRSEYRSDGVVIPDTTSPDKLFVNIAGNSGNKSLRIYDLASLLDEVEPPPPPSPTPTPTVTITITPTISVTPTITPTISVTPSITPTITASPGPTPTITPTISVTPSVTPTISVTPSPTPKVTQTPTPTVSEQIEYRYTRQRLTLENLIPCREYELVLNVDQIQYGRSSIQILDADDIRKTQFDNKITFKSQNIQKYYRVDDKISPIASDTKTYQNITYTIYHQTTLDKLVIELILKDLATGEILRESRIIKCDDKIECDKPRVECVDHYIKCIEQNPDGSFSLYVAVDPVPNSTIDEYWWYITNNKCCHAEYSINGGQWKHSIYNACVNAIELPPTPTPSHTATPTPTPSVTVTQSPTVTSTPAITPSHTMTATPTITPTPTLTPPYLPPIRDCDGVVCVALIDENSSGKGSFATQFELFRKAFPDRLLFIFDVVTRSSDDMVYPPSFAPDIRSFSYYQKTGKHIARGGSATSEPIYDYMVDMVNNSGDQKNIDLLTNAKEFSLFVDDSGSMNEVDVIKTKNDFIAKIESLGAKLVENVVNTDENVFCPFITSSCCGWYPESEQLAAQCGVAVCPPREQTRIIEVPQVIAPSNHIYQNYKGIIVTYNRVIDTSTYTVSGYLLEYKDFTNDGPWLFAGRNVKLSNSLFFCNDSSGSTYNFDYTRFYNGVTYGFRVATITNIGLSYWRSSGDDIGSGSPMPFVTYNGPDYPSGL